MAELAFRMIHDFPRGTLAGLLTDAYSFDPRFARHWASDWRTFDDFFFDHPEIAERCGFITVFGETPIGFASWDPRNRPAFVEIGHNCIAASCKGRGWGTAQMSEAVKRIFSRWSPETIIVTTTEIQLPARRMYERAGFRLVRRRRNDGFCGDFFDYELGQSRWMHCAEADAAPGTEGR